ncbi:unnamed protein product [Ixodes hexagonus]
MTRKVPAVVVGEINRGKYFFLIVGPTPDKTHVDQLAFVPRYIQMDCSIVERFICFLPNPGHKSHELTDAATNTLQSQGTDISNRRGQSYDNATNMSGPYSGLQARVRELNLLAYYVPCAAHSLKLEGASAVESCDEAVLYFGIVQSIYSFFTA